MTKTPPSIVIVGQTPPPWHGQAVATQLLFDHDWPGFQVERVRMAFSTEMEEIGRVRLRKIIHMFEIWKDIRDITGSNRDGILIYPPASPNWTPVLRDLILLPRIRRRFSKVIYIYHAGGVGEWFAKSRFRQWIGRLAYGRADLNLEVAREIPSPHQVLRARRWAWVPYGVDVPPLPAKTSTRDGPTVVLFVGSLQEGKGVIEVIRTAALLKARGSETGFRFRMVGKWFSSEFEEHARRMTAKLGLDAMVEFPGQLTGDDKWRAYRGAHLFLFPTHYESEAFPLVLIEALACGLPVVTTRWRGIPDLVGDCESATLCEIRSPEQYADALECWRMKLQHPENSALLARTFYEERYQPEQFLTQIMSLVTEVAESKIALGSTSASRFPRNDIRSFHAIPSALEISVYLADQNPGHDRSFGISRMSQVVLKSVQESGQANIHSIISKSSQKGPENAGSERQLPWATRRKWVRLLTDHFHPLFARGRFSLDVHYFPKGYLPLISAFSRPSVVTIHDTIIQHDEDHYPKWRNRLEYGYWALLLKHTLREADAILTVSETSKGQIEAFMERHGIPKKEIEVTYEPCLYEAISQPLEREKGNFVIHLASCEPHKRTAHLIRWWINGMEAGRKLPTLHLIGNIPPEVEQLVDGSSGMVKRPFLDDLELQEAYRSARALILPSEIEGFGLPALEAYYLGTPVCYVRETSVDEVLSVATGKGGFTLDDQDSLFAALDDVMAMPPEEIRRCGLKLRETYAAEKVADRMMDVFHRLAGR